MVGLIKHTVRSKAARDADYDVMIIDRLVAVLFFSLLLSCPQLQAVYAEDFATEREALIKEIVQNVQETSLFLGKSALDERVVQAMSSVPRHEFVPEAYRKYAYENRPLPIGYGQTISQPYIVAIMTDLIDVDAGDRVLEVGTGSGYQAAVLAELTNEVYTMEIIRPLGESAAKRLKQLGYDTIHVRIGDGYYGWKEHAPYDAIVVTAAASHIPPPLLAQLKPGGVMMIPVGSRFMIQELLLVEKDATGKVTSHQILPVAFVPLTGTH